jgi:AcrR family transcriptional regulator
MRYDKGHKQATRHRIVETAAARFRHDGIEGVGLADLMAEAGLTHGGFYSHFASKEDLVQAAIAAATNHSRERFEQRIEEGGLAHWIRTYLRPEHRDHPEKGCAAAALAAELARHPKSTRRGFTESLAKLRPAIEAQLPKGMTPSVKRQRAIGIFATLVGAMQLARAVNDAHVSEEILQAGIASALSLARLEVPTGKISK